MNNDGFQYINISATYYKCQKELSGDVLYRKLLVYEQDISLVNFMYYPKESEIGKLKKMGMIENLVATHWLKIKCNDVLPVTDMSKKATPSDCVAFEPKYSKEPIAIVGMSCRYPGSNNLEEFWKILFQGQDATCNPPPFRWKREECSQHRQDSSRTNAGFLKVPVDEFDAKFFGISPKEVLFMDPQHRLLLELVWEALEDACINPQNLHGSKGSVYTGSWMNNYWDILMHSGNTEFYR